MAKRARSEHELEIESGDGHNGLPEKKRVRFNEETPRRTDGHARRKLQLQVVSPSSISMRQVKNSPMRRAIKQGMTVLKFVKSRKANGQNQRKTRTPMKTGVPEKLPAEGEWQPDHIKVHCLRASWQLCYSLATLESASSTGSFFLVLL